jgi:hypothetical protein
VESDLGKVDNDAVGVSQGKGSTFSERSKMSFVVCAAASRRTAVATTLLVAETGIVLTAERDAARAPIRPVD